MAERVHVRGTVDVKLRRPWGGFLLTLVTLGIYYLVWYYKINRELRDYGAATGTSERLGTSPLTSLLAITIGGVIIVPPFVSFYRTFRRIEAAQEVAGLGERVNPWLGFVLFIIGVIFLPFEVVYAQSQLNRLWRAELGR